MLVKAERTASSNESWLKGLRRNAPAPRLRWAALTQLQGYEWPGNGRELRNVVERAVILARGGVLEFDFQDGQVGSKETEPQDF